MIILDTCVLIAFADPANIFHADAERILATTERLAITALTGAELMVHPSPDQSRQWREMLRRLAIDVVPITEDDMEAIAETRRESGLKMPDALVLWLARTYEATVASFDQHLCDRAHQLGITAVH